MRRLAALVVVAVALTTLTGCDDDFRDTCEAQGGVIKEDTKVIPTTVIGPKGQVMTSTTVITTRFCVVDGEIVAQS